MQALIQFIKWFLIFFLVLWSVEDEEVHLVESISNGDFALEWVIQDATCQVNAAHVHREVFKCDGCKRFVCGECGEFFLASDEWLCEVCLLPKEPIIPMQEVEVPF